MSCAVLCAHACCNGIENVDSAAPPGRRMGDSSINGKQEETVGRQSCSFYVTCVPSVVFRTDPEASIRVS